MGKPADHRKLLIALREFVTKTKVNWSPYVAIRRFVRIGCDDEVATAVHVCTRGKGKRLKQQESNNHV